MTDTAPLTNFISYLPPKAHSPNRHPRVGHLNLETSTITPLSHASGTPLSTLYEVITSQNTSFIPSSSAQLALSSVTVLPPLPARDVLAIGKNFAEHAREFHSSGFDSGDKVEVPTHPVVFTKRASSIIPCGGEIYIHGGWTGMVDYEGEVGVIVGREGRQVGEGEGEGWDYVWGLTIINDVTARDRQRDHKQFFLGKSADTFCPMGPIAVPKTSLQNPASLRLTTTVNSVPRQDFNLSNLIFSIPKLIAVISASQTIYPGDVIATGTPVGVGIGRNPPEFLKVGDVVRVSVEGLGTLTNRVSDRPVPAPGPFDYNLAPPSPPPHYGSLTTLPSGKKLYIEHNGVPLTSSSAPVNITIFIHGLGSCTTFFTPLLSPPSPLCAASHNILYDLEGHGLSPTSSSSTISIGSYATDLESITFTLPPGSKISLISHSMGCLIALQYASTHPVHNLILLAPPPTPLPAAAIAAFKERAETARRDGMVGIAEVVTKIATSRKTQVENPLAAAYVKTLLRGCNAEGYAKGCTAFAEFSSHPEEVKWEGLQVGGEVIVVAGDEDKSAPLPGVRGVCESIGGRIVVLEGVGHWLVVEDLEGVKGALEDVLC